MRWVIKGMVTTLLTLCAVGEALPAPVSFTFQDLYFRQVKLQECSSSPACVLFFYSNTCPVARRYLPRMIQLEARYRERGVRFCAVNVSSADTVYDVAEFAYTYGLTFPVVKDRDFSVVKALGITRTPEVVLLDQRFTMVYRGRIDDQYRLGGVQAKATRNELADALDALLGGMPVPTPSAPAEGCVVTLPDGANPSIESDADGREILGRCCLPCHEEGGSGGLAFATPDALRRQRMAITRAVEDGQMPPRQHWLEEEGIKHKFMSHVEREKLLGWLFGSIEGDEPVVAVGPVSAGYDLQFTGKNPAPGDAPDTQDWLLGPATLHEVWVTAILVEGRGRGATLFYTLADEQGERHCLAGGLLPGLPLVLGENEGMALPAGATLHLSMRGEASQLPVVRFRTQSDVPGSSVHCLMASTRIRGKSGASEELIAQPLERNCFVRQISLDVSGFGACVKVSRVDDVGTKVTLMTLPAIDPRWAHPVRVDVDACEIQVAISFPGYSGDVNIESVTANPVGVAGEISATLFTYLSEAP